MPAALPLPGAQPARPRMPGLHGPRDNPCAIPAAALASTQACDVGWWLNRAANTCEPCEEGCERCTSGGPSWRQPTGGGRCTRCYNHDSYEFPGLGLVDGRCQVGGALQPARFGLAGQEASCLRRRWLQGGDVVGSSRWEVQATRVPSHARLCGPTT